MDFKSLLSKLDIIGSKQNLNEGWDDMMKASKEKSEKDKKEKGTGKFDKKETGTGTVYTRKSSTFDDGGEDKDVKKAKKKEKDDKKKVKESDLDESWGSGMQSVTSVPVEKAMELLKNAGGSPVSTPNGIKVDGNMLAVDAESNTVKMSDLNRTIRSLKGVKPSNVVPFGLREGEQQVDEEDVEEGNAFSGAMAKAKAEGKKEFEVDGKTYQVKESKKKKPDADGDGVPDWADKKPGKDDHEDDEQKKLDECYDQAMSRQEPEFGMNISSNMDTKTGNQSLTVSAQGQAADELAQLLKLSGVLDKAIGTPEVEVAMGEEYANEPNVHMQSVAAQLQQGNDLNRPKKTYPKVAGGDNPMQAIAAMEAKAAADLADIERRLMEQLDAIKAAPSQVDKSQVPAAQRKATGKSDWKVTTQDLEKEQSKSPTTKAGLDRLKAQLKIK